MVNIVVVCWNASDYTEVTLKSLISTIGERDPYQITIINNASTDNTAFILNKFEQNNNNVKVITNSINLGIGAAYNQGYEESRRIGAEYTMFCNNDLLFSRNWLNRMLKIMEKDKSIAMLGPLVPASSNFYDDKRTIKEVLLSINNTNSPKEEINEFIGKFDNIDEFSKDMASVNTKIFGSSLRYIDFPNAISSCAVMTRTSVFEQFGWFANPEFKEYGSEDIDMCWRVLKQGYKVAVTNDVYIHHFRGKSIKAANLNRKALLRNSNIKLFNIWKSDIISYYKGLNVEDIDNVLCTPSNWLINEIKDDVNLKEELKSERE